MTSVVSRWALRGLLNHLEREVAFRIRKERGDGSKDGTSSPYLRNLNAPARCGRQARMRSMARMGMGSQPGRWSAS